MLYHQIETLVFDPDTEHHDFMRYVENFNEAGIKFNTQVTTTAFVITVSEGWRSIDIKEDENAIK